MKIHLTTLALALTTIGTACDLEAPTTSTEVRTFRDGEFVDPPTRPVGTGIVVKGGYDNPEDLFALPFLEIPFEYQLEFEKEAEKQAHNAIVAEFLADERNLADCPWVCDDLHMTWNEGVYVTELRVGHGEVTAQTDEKGAHYWETLAEAGAMAGCGCE